MIIASKISYYEGHIKNYQLDNIINMIDSLNLDTDYSKYNYSDLIKYVKSDKKISKGKLNLVLINKQLKAFKTSKFDKKNVETIYSKNSDISDGQDLKVKVPLNMYFVLGDNRDNSCLLYTSDAADE